MVRIAQGLPMASKQLKTVIGALQDQIRSHALVAGGLVLKPWAAKAWNDFGQSADAIQNL